MNRIFVVVIMFAAVFLLNAGAHAQSLARQTLGAAGGELSSPAARLNFTLGEAAAGYLRAPEVTLTQGFQQGGLRVTLSRSPEAPVAEGFRVWPNPARETAHYSAPEGRACRAELYDYSGRKVLTTLKPAHSSEGRLPLGQLAAGAYLLRLTAEDGSNARIFRLIKH